MKLYAICGTGGFGREVMPLAENMLGQQHPDDFRIVFVSEGKDAGSTINNHPVFDMQQFFSHEAKERHFSIAIANHEIRKRIAEFMQSKGAKPFEIVAAEHVRLAENIIGEGAIFCSFTTVTSNAVIGKHFHANIYSYVAHDCVIGDYVTFAPGVHCNGNVIVEDGVYAGTGVIIRQGQPGKPLVIGKNAVLGMGAVVTASVPPGVTVVGNPARPFVRKNTVLPAESGVHHD